MRSSGPRSWKSARAAGGWPWMCCRGSTSLHQLPEHYYILDVSADLRERQQR